MLKWGGAIGKSVREASANMEPDTAVATEADYQRIDLKKEQLLYKLGEFVGDKGVADYKVKSAAGQASLAAVNSDFAKSIVLSDVDLKWSNDYKAWYSVGKIKVANFLKDEVDREMNGYVEVRKTAAGDLINIYLEPNQSGWVYMSYEDNRLALLSASDDVNAEIAKRSKGEKEDRSKYFVVLAEPMEKNKFLTNFRENYLHLKEGEEFEQYKPEEREEKQNPAYQNEEESIQGEKEANPAYQNEEKVEYERKEGTKIEEEEFNREKKEHSVEDKKKAQQDQQRMKDLFK